MYRPELENFTSDIDEIISEKKLRFVGSSGSSNTENKHSVREGEILLGFSLLTFGMIITESRLPHVAQPNGSFAWWVDEEITFFRMELAGSDDFGQLFHVGRLYVNYIKRLICDLHMPEIYSEKERHFL